MSRKTHYYSTASQMISAYKEITGDNNASPKAIGGSTFARAFNKGCAFGPSFDGNKGNYHDANEYIEEKEMLDAYKIYKKAIFNLAKKQLNILQI